MPDPVQQFLDRLNTSTRVRKAAWDAVYDAADSEDFQQRMAGLPFDDATKGKLWEIRFGQGADLPAQQGTATAEQFTEQTGPQGSEAGRFAGNLGAQLNPVSAVKGLYQAVRHPLDAGAALIDAQKQQFGKAAEAYQGGRYSEMIGHGAAGALPILGPAAAAAGEQIGEGDVAGGLGTAAGLGIGTALAGPATRAAGRVIQPVTTRVGEALYQSALKPTKAVLKDVRTPLGAGPDAARQTLVQTGLREKIPVSPRGAKKAETLVDSLNSEVEQRLAAAEARGATVDPTFVEDQIRAVATDFTDQINAQPDLAAIGSVRENFRNNPRISQPQFPVEAESAALTRHLRAGRSPQSFVPPSVEMAPGPISVQTAQRMKRNTYQGLRGKYGTERTATIEAEKAGARGLRQQIETQAPEVAALNAREGAVIPLENAIADAMRRRGNYGIFGLTPVVAAGASVLSGNAWPLLAALVDRMPGVVSRSGIWINRAGQTGRGAQRAMRTTATGNVIDAAKAGFIPAMAEDDPDDPRQTRAQP